MQAYANVGTAPTRHTARASGKVYWEFRASESARGEDKDPTWYTVRIFKDEDPKLNKGDFVVFTGKLKNDVFMGRDGKPMGVLTVLAFNLQKVAKDGKRETVADAPQTVETVGEATRGPAKTRQKSEDSAAPQVSTVSEVAPLAKPLFGNFGQSWAISFGTMRYGA